MIVIADSSPLIALVNIGQIDLLPKLFGGVVIPPEVAAELDVSNRPQAVRDLMASRPPWLTVQSATRIEPIQSLHAGECAAISLARDLNADLILIDEVRGRREAVKRGFRITGTVGVLELAASRGWLNLRDAFNRLKQIDFWISHELLDERLMRLELPERPS
jgi:predicted nucleic acid-binding protein